jgi:DNA-binding transcriptional ArsR family regulator
VGLGKQLANWQIGNMADGPRRRNGPPPPTFASAAVLKALANDRRLDILNWLKDPRANFPPQVDGDLVADGVCSVYIAQKLNVSQPTASEHLRILTHAGLVRAKRIKQWTFYQRDERRIAEVKRSFRTAW